MWIDGNTGRVGVASLYTEPGTIPLETDNYHRLVIAYKQPNMTYYLDGNNIGAIDYSPKAETDIILSRFQLDPNGVLLFASGDYPYEPVDVSRVSIWNKQLIDAEVASLGTIGE
jgi:hypothetical protein